MATLTSRRVYVLSFFNCHVVVFFLDFKAITLCPNVPIYWTNRALGHRKRNNWTRVEEDCRRAIQLDSNSVKAHYMLGLALLQREEYAEGVKELEKV
ncbi:unnamed protein product, partial [Vitis vinifera]